MSQNDLSIANQGFASFRSDLNSALQALGSTNSGTSAPSTTYANQLFYDTTNNILKIRNEDNDAFISLFTLDQTNDNIESLTIDGTLNVNGGVVFNENSADVDFRVESNNDANMLFVDGGNDRVYFGRNVTDGVGNARVQIEAQDGEAGISIHRGSASSGGGKIFFSKSRGASAGDDTVVQSGDQLGALFFTGADGTDRESAGAEISVEVDGTPGSNDMPGRIKFSTTADGASSVTEAMRIDSAQRLLVGKTTQGIATAGFEVASAGQTSATQDGGSALRINRLSDEGEILQVRYDSTTIGSLGSSGSDLVIDGGSNHTGLRFGTISVTPRDNGTATDNANDFGSSSNRWDDIFATNGTINTSDQNEKQDIASATTKELNVAKKLSSLFKTFRWKDKVAEKGDKARTHTGIIAQEIQSSFSAEGLDASKYGLFISDTWWEKEIKVDAVEEDEEKGIEGKEAHTYMDIKEEKTNGYTERTRLGVRYPELFSFIFSSIEARLTALESK